MMRSDPWPKPVVKGTLPENYRAINESEAKIQLEKEADRECVKMGWFISSMGILWPYFLDSLENNHG